MLRKEKWTLYYIADTGNSAVAESLGWTVSKQFHSIKVHFSFMRWFKMKFKSWIPFRSCIDLAPPPEEFSILLVIAVCCGLASMIGVVFAIAFFYKNKKSAMFNEIPTVCIYQRFQKKKEESLSIWILFIKRFRMNRICMDRIYCWRNIGQFNCLSWKREDDSVLSGAPNSRPMK